MLIQSFSQRSRRKKTLASELEQIGMFIKASKYLLPQITTIRPMSHHLMEQLHKVRSDFYLVSLIAMPQSGKPCVPGL